MQHFKFENWRIEEFLMLRRGFKERKSHIHAEKNFILQQENESILISQEWPPHCAMILEIAIFSASPGFSKGQFTSE